MGHCEFNKTEARMQSHPKVLFVCLGNICRSPTAEGVLGSLAPKWEIDSAGTAGWHIGKSPYGPAVEAAGRRGIDLSKLRARQVTSSDFHDFDLILAMDEENLKDLESIRPAGARAELRLFLDFAPQAGLTAVPDPYYTRDFEGALDLIECAARGLVAKYSD